MSEHQQPPVPSLDNDHPLYMRGFVLGMVWETARRDRWVQVELDAPCVEMIMRIADRLGLPFTAEPMPEDPDWLSVTIGTRDDGPEAT